MFSGYLQSAIYDGLNGHLGLAGWRWLFIFCGIISLPFSIWGYIAIPDSPYINKARWLTDEQRQYARTRMEAVNRRPPTRLSWAKGKKILTHWPIYVFTSMLVFQCVVTQPLNYFAVWLESLNRFSVYQINLIPTGAQAVGLVTTLAYGWVSDGLGGKRWEVLLVPGIVNLVGMILVAIGPGFGATLFGYLLNGASWGFWPVLYVSVLSYAVALLGAY
jgi:MFS transporter, ACS family, pantothenate transporter